MTQPNRLPLARRALLVFLQLLRAALPIIAPAVAAVTGVPPAELYQLAALTLDAGAALVSSMAANDAPRRRRKGDGADGR